MFFPFCILVDMPMGEAIASPPLPGYATAPNDSIIRQAIFSKERLAVIFYILTTDKKISSTTSATYCKSCVSIEIFILRQRRSRVRTNAIQICCRLIALHFHFLLLFFLIPQFYTFDVIWFILIVIFSNVDILSQTAYSFSV